MRSKIELYKLVLDKFERNKEEHFICFCINHITETFEEQNDLLEHFYTQRPSKTQYQEFFKNPLFRVNKTNESSWFLYDENQPISGWYNSDAYRLRIDFLKAIINKLETELK